MSVRRARPFVGLAVIAIAGWMIWSVARVKRLPGSVETEEVVADAKTLPAAENEETGCFNNAILDWSGDHLEAGRACKQVDGSSRLENGVLIRFEGKGPEGDVTVKADRGLLPADENQPIELMGHVQLSTPGPTPLVLDGEQLLLVNGRKKVRSEKPVTFRQGDVSGTAGAIEHEIDAHVTTLTVNPVVTIQGQGTHGRVVTLTGERIERNDQRHEVVLTGNGRIDFGDGRVEGQRVDVALEEDGQHVKSVVAIGQARTITRMAAQGLTGPGAGDFERVLSADQVRHQFAGGNRLGAIDAMGGAKLEGHPLSGTGPSESLLGSEVHLEFTPTDPPELAAVKARGTPASFERVDATGKRTASGGELAVALAGQALERLTASGGARLEDQGPRGTQLLEAQSAELRFEAGGTIVRGLDFDGAPAKLTEESSVRPGPRRIIAKKGRLVLADDGVPVDGFLEGAVKMEEPGSRAKADKVEFGGPDGGDAGPQRVTTLTGRALVEQGGRTSHGDKIVRDEGKGTLTVEGTQHTIVRDVKNLPGMEGAQSDEPIYVSSDKLVLDEKARRATYSGGRPALRRGDTEILADSIVVDDSKGSLDAVGAVESRLRMAQPGSEAPKDPGALFDPTRLVESVSRELHYARDESVVHYVGDAKLSQEEASIAADRVDVLLEKGTSKVTGSIASGSALFNSPDREAEGERIEYRASDGSVRVEGGRRPARARDSKGQFVSGGVVEFAPDGSVRVVSPALGRTRGAAPVEEEGPAEAPETGT